MSLDEDDVPSRNRPLSRREFPDEAFDGSEFTDDGTDPCPACGQLIFIDGPWCPKCGASLDSESQVSSRGKWITVLLIIAVAAIILIGLLGK